MKYLIRNMETGECQAVENNQECCDHQCICHSGLIREIAAQGVMNMEGTSNTFKVEVYNMDKPLDIPAVPPMASFLVINDKGELIFDRLG